MALAKAFLFCSHCYGYGKESSPEIEFDLDKSMFVDKLCWLVFGAWIKNQNDGNDVDWKCDLIGCFDVLQEIMHFVVSAMISLINPIILV